MVKTMITVCLLPLIKKYKEKIISISLLLAIGIIFFIALISAYSSVENTSLAYFRRYHLPKLTVNTTDFTTLPTELSAASGMECRFVADCPMITSKDDYVTGRCFFESEEARNKNYKLVKPAESSSTMLNAYIDVSFARYKKIEVGDILNITSPFGKFSVNISALATTPENLNSSRDSFNSFDLESFGYVYLSYDEISEYFSLSERPYNQLRFDSVSDYDTTLSELKQTVSIQSYFSYENSPQLQLIRRNLAPMRILCFVFPPIVLIITIFVSALFVVQILQNERKQVCLYLAMGYTTEKLSFLFSAFSLVVSFVASVLGLVGGHAVGILISNVYFQRFFFPFRDYEHPRWVYLIALAVALFVGLIMSIASDVNIKQMDAAEVFAQHPLKKGFDSGKKLRFLSEMARAQLRFSRNHLKRTIISISGIALTGILLYVAFSFSSSLHTIKTRSIETRYCYDSMVCFDQTLSEEDFSGIFQGNMDVAAVEPAAYRSVTLKRNGVEKLVTLFAVSPNSSMVRPEDKEGKQVRIPKRGIVLEYHTAKALSAKVGDTVFLSDTALLVSAISYQDVAYLQYVSIAQMEALNGGNAIQCALIKEKSDMNPYLFSKNISKLPHYSYITYTDSLQKGICNRADTSIIAVVILLVAGFSIGLIVVTNIALINFRERKHVLATAVSIGISQWKIVFSVCAEFLIEYIAAIVITAIVGIPASDFLLQKLSIDTMSFRNTTPYMTFLQVSILVFLYIFLANLLVLLRIKHADLAKSLQETD